MQFHAHNKPLIYVTQKYNSVYRTLRLRSYASKWNGPEPTLGSGTVRCTIYVTLHSEAHSYKHGKSAMRMAPMPAQVYASNLAYNRMQGHWVHPEPAHAPTPHVCWQLSRCLRCLLMTRYSLPCNAAKHDMVSQFLPKNNITVHLHFWVCGCPLCLFWSASSNAAHDSCCRAHVFYIAAAMCLPNTAKMSTNSVFLLVHVRAQCLPSPPLPLRSSTCMSMCTISPQSIVQFLGQIPCGLLHDGLHGGRWTNIVVEVL